MPQWRNTSAPQAAANPRATLSATWSELSSTARARIGAPPSWAAKRAAASSGTGGPATTSGRSSRSQAASASGSNDGATSGVGAKAAQRNREARGDPARMAAGKGDRRPVARPSEQRHAVMEEVDRRFEIVGGEMQPLRRTAGARGLERDDARDGALRQRQQRRIVGQEVGRRGERQAREVVDLGERAIRPIAAGRDRTGSPRARERSFR